MKFHQLVKAAIHEPKKLAAFRLLPIGKVFRYVFIFVALFTLLSFIRYIAGDAALIRIFTGTSSNTGNNWRTHLSDCISSATRYQYILYLHPNQHFWLCGNPVAKTDEKTWRIPSYVENFCYCDYHSYSSDNWI